MQGENAKEARTWIEAWRKGPNPPAASTSAPSPAESSNASSSQSKSPKSEAAGKVRLRLTNESGLQVYKCSLSKELSSVGNQPQESLSLCESHFTLHLPHDALTCQLLAGFIG